MSVRKEPTVSNLYLTGLVVFVLIASMPVSASSIISPDTNQSSAVHIGTPAPILAADTLTITANKDSVLRGGGRFSVTITGNPGTFYYLWVKNTSTMTGEPQDQPPAIIVSEPVYQDPTGGPFSIGSHLVPGGGGRTILNDIPPSTANISNTEYYAAIRTNSRGVATVEWNAYLATKPGSYTIHIEGDTLSADTTVSVDSAINSQYGPVTGFFAQPEYVILHPAVNTMGENSSYEGLININRGASVFIGEQGLNISTALSTAQTLAGRNSTVIGWWASPDDALTSHSTVAVDLAGREHNFLVSQAEFDGYEGDWHLVDPVTGFSCSNGGSPVLVLNVRTPRLDIGVWDLDIGRDVSGRAIPLGENLTFRVDTNLCLALDKDSRPAISNNTQGIITIKVKGENGAVLNYLYRHNATVQSLTNLSVNTSTWFWGGGTTPGRNYWATNLLDRDHYYYYTQGTYVISAESTLNNMKENYLSGSAAYTGRTVSETEMVTLVSDIVQISTNSDSVVHGYPFEVQVQGRPLATYHIWIENTSTMMGTYGDQPPVIAPSQAGISQDRDPGLTNRAPVFPEAGAYQFQGGGGKAIYQDVAPGWPYSISPLLKNGTLEYANITLSSSGTRWIQFLTTNGTKPKTYTIRVEQVFPVSPTAEGGTVKRDSVDVTVRGTPPDTTSISVSPDDDIISPGTPVTVTIDRPCNAFPEDGELLLSTGLDNPQWTYKILVNGIENQLPAMGGHNLSISGWELSYRSSDNVAIHVVLHGQYPGSNGNVMLLKIQQRDVRGNPVPGTTIVENRPRVITDTSSSGDTSGTSGQTVSSHAGAGPGETMTFLFSQSGDTVTISQIDLVPVQQIGNLELIAQPVTPGQTLQVSGHTVAGYMQITPVGLNPSVIDHGTITFGVAGTWLSDHNAEPEEIVLMRYYDTQWIVLPTRFDHKTGDIFSYTAETPGFSYFAVAVKPAGSSEVNTSTTFVLPSRVQTASAEPISQTTVDWDASAKTVVSQTTTSIPLAPSSAAPPISVMTFAFALIVCIGLVAGAVITRSWWIRRQNPSLFQKEL
jgi:PGF-pre-PGF domain-containing protein